MPIDRRSFLALTAAFAAEGCASSRALDAPAEASLAELERTHGGRLGVMAVDLGSGRQLAHRADERFPMCSTFKTLLAAQVLTMAGDRPGELERTIPYGRADLVDHAPVTEQNVARGAMTVGELCAAAITVSDNTAANLLITHVGGLAAFGAYLRGIGDDVTRLDRTETALGEGVPGDPRDTTTPRAMAADLRRLFLGDALSVTACRQLTEWHLQTATGLDRLRAGLPPAWRLAHKTGAGEHGVVNDMGIAWPPARAPLVIAAFYAESAAPYPAREAVLAEVGRLAARLA